MSDQSDMREPLPATLDELTALGLGPDRRRFILAALLAVGTAGVPLPAIAKVTRARRKAGRFLTPARFAVLDALAETIMPRTDTPGARDALVPQRFDALMQNWASADTQAKFTVLLDEAEAAARAAGASGLAAMPASQAARACHRLRPGKVRRSRIPEIQEPDPVAVLYLRARRDAGTAL